MAIIDDITGRMTNNAIKSFEEYWKTKLKYSLKLVVKNTFINIDTLSWKLCYQAPC